MFARAVLVAVVTAASALCAAAQEQPRPAVIWNHPDVTPAAGVTHASFHSASMDTEVGYSVYLPPEYASSKARYPVIYFLHGAGGNENSDAGGFSGLVARIVTEKKVPSAICVFPNGGMSGYRDRPDQKVMGETMIVKELVPLIDRTYRTKRSRDARMLAGFSMGGGGATRLAIKHPDLFSAAASWAGVLMPRQSSDLPEFSVERLHKLRGQVRLLMIVGDKDMTFEAGKATQERLAEAGYPVEYKVLEGISHDLGAYYRLTGEEVVRFLCEKF